MCLTMCLMMHLMVCPIYISLISDRVIHFMSESVSCYVSEYILDYLSEHMNDCLYVIRSVPCFVSLSVNICISIFCHYIQSVSLFVFLSSGRLSIYVSLCYIVITVICFTVKYCNIFCCKMLCKHYIVIRSSKITVLRVSVRP